MFALDDLTGRRFGRLTVVGRAENYATRDRKYLQTQWYCDCDCGEKGVIVLAGNLKSGRTVSCGCYRKERCRAMGKRRAIVDDYRGKEKVS